MSQRQRYILLGIFLCLASTMLMSQNVNITLSADSAAGSNNRCVQNGVEGGSMIVHQAANVSITFTNAPSLVIQFGNCSANCVFTSNGSTVSGPTPSPAAAGSPMPYNSVKTSTGTVLCNPNGDGLIMH